MCSTIIHRGPDDEGTFVEGSLGIGMRRLSIIDVSHGGQPVFNEDRSVAVVFNGEIFNFLELRKELEAKGHRFATRSDTEVIVHLYEEMGDRFPERLNGMFAIALWDIRQRRLVLVRDRLGVKPLYFAHTADGIVFGSELKCVLQAEGIDREIDHESLYHYFTLGYIPHPGSIYRQVRQLPPGTRLTVTETGENSQRYWTLNQQVDHKLDRREAEGRLRELLVDAVRIRMISDVPLGAFLSGGLDSSIVVALMARQSTTPVKTFHIDFEEPDYTERAFARSVAEMYGTDHHELVVRPSAVDILDDLVRHFDEPFADSSAIPTYYVSQLTRQHVTVALAGDGGDESFGGYSRYRRILDRKQIPAPLRAVAGSVGEALQRVLPRSAPGKRFLRTVGMEHGQFFAVGAAERDARDLFTGDFLESINGASTFELLRESLDSADRTDRLSRFASVDLHHYLPDDILTKVDRMSMAHSLEVRAPFLDYRVVELAATFPWNWKIGPHDSKLILKEIFRDELPPSVLTPRKRGFSIPLADWLRGELRPLLDAAIGDSDLAEAGIVKMSEVRALRDEHMSGARNRSVDLWRFLFFERWWQQSRSELKQPETSRC
jgi:asparagine synthase (glutamine-hydrolysing)